MTLDVPGLESLELRKGRRVLVRLDLNVPLQGGVVQDDLRITAALPTIEYLRERGAIVVACSHLGRPDGVVDPAFSLAPVAQRLTELVGPVVELAPAVVGPRVEPILASSEPGTVVLLENLRFERGETENDPAFGTNLSMLADVYVNDAFGSSHRAHASIVAPPRVLPHAGGRLLFREVEALGRVLREPARPFVAVLGGAKVSDKLGVIAALLDRCDSVLVGGAMAFTFLRARGLGVGASLVEPDFVAECTSLLESGRVEIPVDVVVAEGPSPTASTAWLPSTRSQTGGWVSTSAPRPPSGTPRAWATRRRCSGTARWGCSSWRRSPREPNALPERSPSPTGSLSSVEATAPLPSASSGSTTVSTT